MCAVQTCRSAGTRLQLQHDLAQCWTCGGCWIEQLVARTQFHEQQISQAIIGTDKQNTGTDMQTWQRPVEYIQLSKAYVCDQQTHKSVAAKTVVQIHGTIRR